MEREVGPAENPFDAGQKPYEGTLEETHSAPADDDTSSSLEKQFSPFTDL